MTIFTPANLNIKNLPEQVEREVATAAALVRRGKSKQ